MSESTASTVAGSAAPLIASAETEFAWTDAGVVLLVVLGAFFYLYVRLWRKRGACPECGSKDGHCSAKARNTRGAVTKIPVDEVHKTASK